MADQREQLQGVTRREFTKASAAAAVLAGVPAAAWGRVGVHTRVGRLKVGVIGCGGRGTGAATDILNASPDTEIHALGDAFKDRLEGSRKGLAEQESGLAERARVPDERCFVGFDAYKQVLASGVDIVILATPPGFRPIHFAAAIEAGKHVFFEKPVAVDPAGVRMVIEAARKAEGKGLCIVTGTQRRHERVYLEAMKRMRDGQIGKISGAMCFWNQGGLWMNPRQPGWTDMEWQLRNWLYFTWLSGDHICEQHVHNLDAVNWALGGPPNKCLGMGGRQVRTDPAYGHVFDHFAIDYEYPGGVRATSMCRQIEGCADRVEEVFLGSEGTCNTSSGRASIRSATGSEVWKFQGENPNPYVVEHKDLIGAITSGKPINEGVRVAESTLTAIMGRMSAYTGKTVTWEQAMNSKLELMPKELAMGAMATPEVAVPGKTPLI